MPEGCDGPKRNNESASSQHSLRAYPCYEALVCDRLQHLLHALVAWGAMEAIGVHADMPSFRHDHTLIRRPLKHIGDCSQYAPSLELYHARA